MPGEIRWMDEIEASLSIGDEKPLVRLVVCGEEGRGKRTLIDRLLSGSGSAPEAGSPAQACFETASRRVLATIPAEGEHWMQTLASEAGRADYALIVIDPRNDVATESRRHTHLLRVFGVPDIALAVNKMDLIGYAPERLAEIEKQYREMASEAGVRRVTCIPTSALAGDNVCDGTSAMSGYEGPTVSDYLDGVTDAPNPGSALPFRMYVQSTEPTDAGRLECSGTIASGSIGVGEVVLVSPSGSHRRVAAVHPPDGQRSAERGETGQSVRLVLAAGEGAIGGGDKTVRSGDLLADPRDPPSVASQIEATVVWVGDEPMLRGRTYLMRIGGATVTATITPLKYKLDLESREHLAAIKLERTEIGVCEIELSEAVPFDPFLRNRLTGIFALVDPVKGTTVGLGMISFALRRAQNVHWQDVTIDKRERATSMRQRPTAVWLTGISGAGKSTIANLIEGELHKRGHHTYLLDGDNVRHGLNSDLGFTKADRVENIRRVAEVAHLMVDAGLIVLVSFITPFRAERRMARSLFEPDEFLEVFVETPLAVAEARDPKGLYRKARRGELTNFTGIDSPYEIPEKPDITVHTAELSAHDAAHKVIAELETRGRLEPRVH
jgi:bifunctional enzyme CysN/CysC